MMSNLPPAGNLLGQETSPYLLQHKDNPVHWQPWGEPAFARARDEGKAVLLSVGYAACHWCHVMARECFEDERIAALMNRLFVNIKVDREERPDLDSLYQATLSLFGRPGGWPLTLFLTDEGVPFWGGTYFPPTARHGRPGFGEVLIQVADAYRREPETIARAAGLLRLNLGRLAEAEAGGALPPAIRDQAAARLVQEVDPVFGGLGGAPKFPQVPGFELLWRAWLRTGRAVFRTAVTITLTRMCQGGIYDHLAGGFARYATDDEWLVPHFEKMLYDNAQLLDQLTLVWQGTGDRLYALRAAETADWVLREMVAEGGGFAGSLDADSDHREGLYTVWSAAEIDSALGPAAARFKQAYDVTPRGNWEGMTILNRSRHPELGTPAEEAELTRMRSLLLALRDRRPRPGWDDKVLADWNGLMIAALARASLAFGRPDWLTAAERAFAFVVARLGARDRLVHSWRAGRPGPRGLLDDYAAMALAALALHEATGDPTLLAHARGWVAAADRHFWDAGRGGYCLSPDDGEPLLVRIRSAQDQATPSGNGVMVGVLARLFQLTGEERYQRRAEALVRAFSGEIDRNLLGIATLLNGAEFLEQAISIVIVGPETGADTLALGEAVAGLCLPDRVVMRVVPGASWPAGHPAAGKPPVGGRAAAYICSGQSCAPAITEPAALVAALVALHPKARAGA